MRICVRSKYTRPFGPLSLQPRPLAERSRPRRTIDGTGDKHRRGNSCSWNSTSKRCRIPPSLKDAAECRSAARCGDACNFAPKEDEFPINSDAVSEFLLRRQAITRFVCGALQTAVDKQ
ncbi:hypothetical protein F443_00278 [Phytophthora nicotianae P1569]|uniref:Uncharacterized protein n=1 Tax=Phytophthora nicotianae P1569 TaxID=1317065 RepID=V9G110_PHYNI|nr:hypothetical protein F443_00278 [Phytophthora nicotianae P1569]